MSPATRAGGSETSVVLRAAVDADAESIATIWHRGWRDGHLGHVPPGLADIRTLDDFRGRVPDRLDTTTVATVEGAVVGFVMVVEDEVEQMYVDAAARATGVADALLAHGEAVVGERFDRAWLAVVAGNARARRFYERNGWSDTGPFDTHAWAPDGTTIAVPALRYEKPVSS